MSISLVQNAKAGANATSQTATLTGVAAGNALIIVLVGNSGATVPTSIVDASGDTVSVAVTFATTSSRAGIGLYYVQNTSSGTHAITANWPSANSAALFVAEYSGLATSGVFDVASAIAFAASTTIATAAITPAQNGELLILGIGQQGLGETYSAYTNSFTQQDSSSAAAPSSAWASLIQATAASISGGATSTSNAGSGAAVAAFKAAGSAPTISSVNGGSAIAEGATNVAVVGTNLTSATLAITQPAGVSVAQTIGTAFGATGGNFNLVVEPGSGDQLAFTDATYTTNAVATTGAGSSTPLAITVTPPAGLLFQTLASINPTPAYDFTSVGGTLAIGDQVEAAGNSAGTAAAPSGLTLNNDATITWSATPANFWARLYDGTAKTWTAFAAQNVTGGGGSSIITPPTGSINFENYNPNIAPSTGIVGLVGVAPVLALAIAVGTGSLSFSGAAPNLGKNVTITPPTGQVILTTQTSANVTISPSTGALNLAGAAPALTLDVSAPVTGVISLLGYAPTVTASSSTSITPTTGALTLTGYAVTQTYSLAPPNSGQILLSGGVPVVAIGYSIGVGTGAITLVGYTPVLVKGTVIAPATGALSVVGIAPLLAQGRTISPATGALAFVTAAPTTGLQVSPVSGSITFAGQPAQLNGQTNIAPPTGALTLSGVAPQLQTLIIVIPLTGALSFVGVAPTLKVAYSIAPPSGSLALTGQTPQLGASVTATPSTGSVSLTGQLPVLGGNSLLTPSSGAIAVSGQVPQLSQQAVVVPTTGQLLVVGSSPILAIPVVITPPSGSLNLVGYSIASYRIARITFTLHKSTITFSFTT